MKKLKDENGSITVKILVPEHLDKPQRMFVCLGKDCQICKVLEKKGH